MNRQQNKDFPDEKPESLLKEVSLDAIYKVAKMGMDELNDEIRLLLAGQLRDILISTTTHPVLRNATLYALANLLKSHDSIVIKDILIFAEQQLNKLITDKSLSQSAKEQHSLPLTQIIHLLGKLNLSSHEAIHFFKSCLNLQDMELHLIASSTLLDLSCFEAGLLNQIYQNCLNHTSYRMQMLEKLNQHAQKIKQAAKQDASLERVNKDFQPNLLNWWLLSPPHSDRAANLAAISFYVQYFCEEANFPKQVIVLLQNATKNDVAANTLLNTLSTFTWRNEQLLQYLLQLRQGPLQKRLITFFARLLVEQPEELLSCLQMHDANSDYSTKLLKELSSVQLITVIDGLKDSNIFVTSNASSASEDSKSSIASNHTTSIANKQINSEQKNFFIYEALVRLLATLYSTDAAILLKDYQLTVIYQGEMKIALPTEWFAPANKKNIAKHLFIFALRKGLVTLLEQTLVHCPRPDLIELTPEFNILNYASFQGAKEMVRRMKRKALTEGANATSIAAMILTGEAEKALTEDDLQLVNSKCEKALELEPLNTHALTLKINLALQDYQFDEAKRLLNSVMANKQNTALIARYRNQIYVNRYQYREAINDCEAVLANEPGDPDILSARAHAYQKLGYYHLALSEYSTIISKFPRHVSGLNGCADTYFHLGEFIKSAEFHRKVLTVEPNNVYLQLNNSLVSIALGHLEQARQDLSKIELPTQANPKRLVAYWKQLGFHIIEQISQAGKQLDNWQELAEEIQQEPYVDNFIEIMMFAAIVYTKLNYFDLAHDAVDRLLSRNAYCIPALLKKATIYLQQGQAQHAKDYYERILEVEPEHCEVKEKLLSLQKPSLNLSQNNFFKPKILLSTTTNSRVKGSNELNINNKENHHAI